MQVKMAPIVEYKPIRVHSGQGISSRFWMLCCQVNIVESGQDEMYPILLTKIWFEMITESCNKFEHSSLVVLDVSPLLPIFRVDLDNPIIQYTSPLTTSIHRLLHMPRIATGWRWEPTSSAKSDLVWKPHVMLTDTVADHTSDTNSFQML